MTRLRLCPHLNGRDAEWLLVWASVNQVEMPAHLSLDRDDGSIRQPGFSFSIKSDTYRKPSWLVCSNDLNACHGLAPGPLPDRLKAHSPKGIVFHSNSRTIWHTGSGNVCLADRPAVTL
jgi:hypothetical protein